MSVSRLPAQPVALYLVTDSTPIAPGVLHDEEVVRGLAGANMSIHLRHDYTDFRALLMDGDHQPEWIQRRPVSDATVWFMRLRGLPLTRFEVANHQLLSVRGGGGLPYRVVIDWRVVCRMLFDARRLSGDERDAVEAALRNPGASGVKRSHAGGPARRGGPGVRQVGGRPPASRSFDAGPGRVVGAHPATG